MHSYVDFPSVGLLLLVIGAVPKCIDNSDSWGFKLLTFRKMGKVPTPHESISSFFRETHRPLPRTQHSLQGHPISSPLLSEDRSLKSPPVSFLALLRWHLPCQVSGHNELVVAEIRWTFWSGEIVIIRNPWPLASCLYSKASSVWAQVFQSPGWANSPALMCVELLEPICHVQASGTWYFAIRLIHGPSFASAILLFLERCRVGWCDELPPNKYPKKQGICPNIIPDCFHLFPTLKMKFNGYNSTWPFPPLSWVPSLSAGMGFWWPFNNRNCPSQCFSNVSTEYKSSGSAIKMQISNSS